ncbi:hypothetical protein [Marinobacterium arenosum]|uniref:hypothetical protein n=1 Tax=Marinobacterium arenosum TaxID=2862496 RepID=UPI001C93D3CA|nr:hypothetical protein [Marinobacterium arenosum]MBY4675006.1 hypothetical protein [Marinobacterium arenosum]
MTNKGCVFVPSTLDDAAVPDCLERLYNLGRRDGFTEGLSLAEFEIFNGNASMIQLGREKVTFAVNSKNPASLPG